MIEDFGVIIACCASDYLFAKGCCASVRYFLGNVPICLLIDGNFSVAPMEKLYQVHVIHRHDVQNQFLRSKSFGWGKTKMVGFWQSPWSNFLMLDADTNVWGNMLKYANFPAFDLIADRPKNFYSDEAISHFFFDVGLIEKQFPEFPWYHYRNNYFCTGVFFGKKNIFSLDEYAEMLSYQDTQPELFKYGEMGLLNFMVFRAAHEGRLRLDQHYMQIIMPDYSLKDLENRFPVTDKGPLIQQEDGVILHWCGAKPTVNRPGIYDAPMSYFRRQYLQKVRGNSGRLGELILRAEDAQRKLPIYQNKITKKIKQFLPSKVEHKL